MHKGDCKIQQAACGEPAEFQWDSDAVPITTSLRHSPEVEAAFQQVFSLHGANCSPAG